MMQPTTVKDVQKSRVNITLNIEKNGSLEKLELPFKLLVIGKFTHRSNNSKVMLQERVRVDKENLNDVMKKFSPCLSLKIPDLVFKKNDCLDIHLTFERYQDFRPENILMQVDFLKRLVAARNLLKELKSHIIDSESLRKSLEELVRSKAKAQLVYKELKRFRLDRNK